MRISNGKKTFGYFQLTERSLSENTRNIAFYLTLTGVGIVGLVDGVLQSSLYALAAVIDFAHSSIKPPLARKNVILGGTPGSFAQSLQLGTGIAGVLVASNRVITKFLFSDDVSFQSELPSSKHDRSTNITTESNRDFSLAIERSTYIFFFISTLMQVMSFALFLWCTKLVCYKYYLSFGVRKIWSMVAGVY